MRDRATVMIAAVEQEALPHLARGKVRASWQELPIVTAPHYFVHFSVGRPPRRQSTVGFNARTDADAHNDRVAHGRVQSI
jgi:hypothetical protein